MGPRLGRVRATWRKTASEEKEGATPGAEKGRACPKQALAHALAPPPSARGEPLPSPALSGRDRLAGRGLDPQFHQAVLHAVHQGQDRKSTRLNSSHVKI